MIASDLIHQQHDIARSLRDVYRQYQKSLDAVNAAQEQEIAAAEQQRLEANRQYDALLAEFLELEQGARAAVRNVYFEAFDKVGAAPTPLPAADPLQTFAECKAEIERIFPKLSDHWVYVNFVSVPSGIDEAAVMKKLTAFSKNKWESCPKTGNKALFTLNNARTVILEMETLGIKAELAA